MGGWWITDQLADPNGKVLVVSWLVWVVVSITLHELAHGWAAIRLGDDTPIRSGHMTWNPMVHMGPFSLAALLLVGIAWGAMPVDPSRLRGKYGDTLVSIAGPMMNLALGVIALTLLVFWDPLADGQIISSITVQEPLRTNLYIFLKAGAFLNFVLMLFNLLPTPPLDGGRILMDLWPAYRRLMQSEHGQWVGLGIFIFFFIFLINYVVLVSSAMVVGVVEVVQGLLFPTMN